MSASRNPDGPGAGTEFSSKREGDKPLMTGGHQPGKLVKVLSRLLRRGGRFAASGLVAEISAACTVSGYRVEF
ncbi:uncharacterized protein RCC_09229 [Ramularia collo-cygni]|uniref:Uncharacterized protein n=1 Tax=Ramularia collo-cygni TaxID=112498 RepID=A0A2D3VCR7_9PEZI|nr:uncharacterized protein RCC_09229 [Ramularia collo-cygni]CZT23515.1 uncharacterized protein RCC_09229 [Ramularia collo-cygni]